MKWWAEYDLDGAHEIYHCADGVTPTAWAHLIGPFDTYTEAKKALLRAMAHCVLELKGAMQEIKSKQKWQLNGG